jgi:hypothetical protein
MFSLFSIFLQKIQTLLAVRAECNRIRVIRAALQSYAEKRGINRNNNEWNSL